MPQNKYVEYRKWIAFWGLLLDSQKEIQKMIDDYNSKGWKVVQFQYTRPNFSIGKLLLILLITAITFGFISYWIGVSIIFEREDDFFDNDDNYCVIEKKQLGYNVVDINYKKSQYQQSARCPWCFEHCLGNDKIFYARVCLF